MSRRQWHTKNLDLKEICEGIKSLKTHDYVPIRKIIVANISQQTTHKELKNEFSNYGKVVDCILKKKSGKKKNYAFITYSTCREAQKAIKAGYSKSIKLSGQNLRVIPTVSWHQPDSVYNQNRNHSLDESLSDGNSGEEQTTTCNNSIIDDCISIHCLNNDCLMVIFSYLSYVDRIRIERVCKRWQAICQELWFMQKKLDLNPILWGLDCVSGHRSITTPETNHVHKIISKCGHHLRHIDLSEYSDNLENLILIELAKLCPNLQSINMKNFHYKASGVEALAKNCNNILRFSIGNSHHSNESITNELSYLFSKHQQIQHIEVNSAYIPGFSFKNFPTKSLMGLIWRDFYNFGNNFYKALEKMKNLRVLRIEANSNIYLDGTSYSEFVKIISTFSKLEELELSSRYPIEEEGNMFGRGIDDFVLAPIIKLSNLKVLSLKSNHLVNDCLLTALAQNCTKLSDIDISYCSKVTNQGLLCITLMPNLEHLSINKLEKVTDEVLMNIPKLRTLHCRSCINLRHTGLVKLLESCEGLEVLDLTDCRFISNEVVFAASKAATQRQQTVLKLCITGTDVKLSGLHLTEYPPLLKIVKDRQIDSFCTWLH